MRLWRLYVLAASFGSFIGFTMSHLYHAALACFAYAQWQLYQFAKRQVQK